MLLEGSRGLGMGWDMEGGGRREDERGVGKKGRILRGISMDRRGIRRQEEQTLRAFAICRSFPCSDWSALFSERGGTCTATNVRRQSPRSTSRSRATEV